MDQILRTLSNYVISALLFIAGMFYFIKYVAAGDVETQPLAMLGSSLILIAVGVLISPFVMDRLEPKVHKGLMAAGTLASIFLVYSVYFSIDDEIEFLEAKLKFEETTIQRLTDIRDAEKAYFEVHGAYTNDFDTLIAFIKAPEMPVKFSIGSFHDTLPESASYEGGYVLKRSDIPGEAVEMGLEAADLLALITEDDSPYKVRDTLYTSYFAENFTAERRAAKKLPRLSMDSLTFSPSSGARFLIDTTVIEGNGGLRQSAVVVVDPTPFGRDKVKKDTLRFGSLTEAHVDGNWRQ